MKSLNKEGFTLIELLAVIAILAILFMLVTPNILKMFTSGKKQAFVTQVQSVAKAAEAQYMSEAFTGTPGPYCSGTDGKKLDVSESGLTYYVSFDTNGNISKLVVVDGNFAYESTENFSASAEGIQNSMKQVTSKTDAATVLCTGETAGTLSGFTLKDID